MNTLSGKKAEAFVKWLEEARYYLPPKMSIDEARGVFEQKLKEEEELKNEKR